MNFSYDRKRNPLFNPMHQSFANYCTDTMSKSDLHRDFGDELFLNNLHLIPDPLKKNLADTIITSEKPQKQKQNHEKSTKMSTENLQEVPNSTLSGIFSFFTGVFNSLSGAMFRPKSPVYYDCFTPESDWQKSNTEADKIGPLSSPVVSENASDMSPGVRTAAKTCEGKLNQIRYVLEPNQTGSVWVRKRPKKVFIEPGSVEENFEDAFSPEDFISMPNQTFIECYSPISYQKEELYQTGALKIKVEPPRKENIDIVNVIDKEKQENSVLKDNQSLECGKNSLNLGKVETENTKREKDSLKSEENKLNLQKQNKDKIEFNTKQKLDSKIDCQNLTKSSEIKKLISNIENMNSNVEKKNSNVENKVLNIENKDSNTENKNSNMEPSDKSIDEVDYAPTDKHQIINSCEDKLSKLKALLSKSKKPRPTYINLPEDNLKTAENTIDSRSTYIPEDTTSRCTYVPKDNNKTKVPNSTDKHFKNPHRTTDKRKKSKLKKNINDDMIFANELDSEVIDESPLNSYTQTCLGDYFDEVTGRFRTASTTDSDDSFQIVFNDKPRVRIPSECDSEDSFIIFEDSPDSCYTSNDVFGDSETESDSDVSDSGCSTLTCKLSHSLSRTVSNLTDDSLYIESSDEIDSSNVETVLKCDEVNKSLLIDDEVKDSLLVDDETDNSSVESVLKCDEVFKSLLMDDEKKKSRRDQPAKKVHFSSDPPKVHLMRVWAFAARQARAGHWERYAVDRERFKRRIADVDVAVSWVLKPQHRSRVMFQRFMPWWNAQRRRELAEKKQKEEEQKQQEELEKQEEERVKEQELIDQELLQQEDLEKEVLKEQELPEKQSEDLIKSQELLQQQKLECRELPEKRIEKCNIKRDDLLQQELERKEHETKQEELAKQEFLPQREEFEKSEELTKQNVRVNNEELIKLELLQQKELIQQKIENSNKPIEEAKNPILPLFFENGENSQKNLGDIVQTLDSCNKKSNSSNDCTDFNKTLSKDRKNNQILS